MRIKKLNTNEYFYTGNDIWVRNFTNIYSPKTDINNLSSSNDATIFLQNELKNKLKKLPLVTDNLAVYDKVVIVSDGYNFKNHNILAKLPKEITIFAVNHALAKWKLLGSNSDKRIIDWYIVNNPYQECTRFLPTQHRYYPRCIASSRTNFSFIDKYLGSMWLYNLPNENKYSGIFNSLMIEDYRNPICAAIYLSFLFHAKKILLFACDDSFEHERPGAEKLDNGLWSYPPQQTARKVIDGMLYWLKEKEIEVADYSSGIKLNYCSYINNEQDIYNFFKEEQHE